MELSTCPLSTLLVSCNLCYCIGVEVIMTNLNYMDNAPLAGYEDAARIGKTFHAVRAYDPDQVDGLCIQTPDCEYRGGGIYGHGTFCPMSKVTKEYEDNSHATLDDWSVSNMESSI